MANKEIDKATERDFLVVTQLPTQQMRVAIGEDDKEYSILTVEEALTEMLRILRKVEKSVA